MSVNCRQAAAADLQSAAELIRDHPLFSPYGLTPARLLRSLEAALAQDDGVLVAAHHDEILGLIWVQQQGAFGRSGYVRLLVTSSKAQGRGIGSSLLAAAEEMVFRHSADMFLLANSLNLAAITFYERLGYKQVGTIPDYVAPGLTEEILHKKRPA